MQVLPFDSCDELELPDDGRPLVVTLSRGEGLGDALLELPFHRAVRDAVPDAFRLHVVSESSSALFGPIQRFAEPAIDAGLTGGHFLTSLLPRPSRLRRLPLADLAFVVFTRWLDVAGLRHAVRARRCLTVLPGYWLSDGAPARRRRPPNRAARLLSLHEAAWGRPAPSPRLPLLEPLPEAMAEVAAMLPLPAAGRPFAGYVGISLGRRPDRRAWPVARGAELARALRERGFVPVLLVGPQELDTVGELRAACPQASLPLRADGGPLGIESMLAVASRLRVAVTKDGGLAHLLAGAGVPLVDLVANGRPVYNLDPFDPRKWAPVGAPVALVCGRRLWHLDAFDVETRPARAHDGRRPSRLGVRDVVSIDVSVVLKVLDELLERVERAASRTGAGGGFR